MVDEDPKILSDAVAMHSEIDRAVSNFKKDGPSRKTYKYLKEKLEKIATLENGLKSTHDKFIAAYPEPSELFIEDKDNATKLLAWLKQEIVYLMGKMEEFAKNNPSLVLDDISLDYLKQPGTSKGNEKDTTKVKPTDGNKDGKTGNIEEKDSEDDEESSFYRNDEHDDDILKKLVKAQDGLFRNIKYQLNTMGGIEKMAKEQIEYRMSRLIRAFKKAEDTDYEIWSLAQEPEVFGYKHDLFFQLSTAVEVAVTKLRILSTDSTKEKIKTTINSFPKLPEITCPVFEGDYKLWNPFIELFNELIHSRNDIGNVQKMLYLKRNLNGEPLTLIKNLALVDQNYEIALETLRARYNNKRLIVNAHLSQMLDRSQMSQQSAMNLKKFHDDIRESVQALERLEINTKEWDPILQFLLTRKLDNRTRMLYEVHLQDSKSVPPIDTLLSFLQIQFSALESFGRQQNQREEIKKNVLVATQKTCIMEGCDEVHHIYMCPVFKQKTPYERYAVARGNNLCLNCLIFGHKVFSCRSRTCTKCHKKHHTLIHMDNMVYQEQEPMNSNVALNDEMEQGTSALHASSTGTRRKTVLLATAMVTIKHIDSDRTLTCRAVLDSGSQLNVMSSKIFNKLGIAGTAAHVEIEGIGLSRKRCHTKLDVTISSDVTKHTVDLSNVIVMENITSSQPSLPVNVRSLGVPNNIVLADEDFGNPREIGLLLGAGIVGPLLLPGNIGLGEGKPCLQNTKLGWVVIGSVYNLEHANYFCGIASFKSAKTDKVNNNAFWDIEQLFKKQTADERRCEKLFNETTKRNLDGRFVVRIPFKLSPTLLGSSENVALSRFFSMERKLETNEEIKYQYHDFMNKYITLGHMEEVKRVEDIGDCKFYLPHHFVLKPGSTTTKLRVVFDAAATTSSNIALNDVLATGPKLQNDLFDIILRFRTHRFVLTGDIQMMYRQIMIHSDDYPFHLIFWRFNKSEKVKVFRLKTVTYGTSCAPYLAVKCLQNLANINMSHYPTASNKILQDFYMDDFITGDDSLVQLENIRSEVANILEKGGFHLRKWCSNNASVLRGLPIEECETKWNAATGGEAMIKVLGISWKPDTDLFQININLQENYDRNSLTKRKILSEASGIFDPLGLVSPVIVVARILLQELWQAKLDWDARLDEEFKVKWDQFRSNLHLLRVFQIPRWVFSDNFEEFEIHGFSDASWNAYGAVLYIRTISNAHVNIQLLCSKSRVVSIKKRSQIQAEKENRISIPRLELCAAKLLVELINKVKQAIQKDASNIFCYSDSTTVLQWIKKPCNSLKPYIARRVEYIQNQSVLGNWGYVASKDNPADILSRGVSPEKFMKCEMWTQGPQFLQVFPTKLIELPQKLDREDELSEVEFKVLTTVEKSHFLKCLNHRNSFSFLVGVVATMLCFISRLRKMTSEERPWREVALIKILLYMQREFQEEVNDILTTNRVKSSSRLKTLTPFVDQDGLIRVGGRIKNANYLSFDAKHQILIPYGHPFTFLLANEIHKKHLHVSSKALLYIIRQKFWPLKGTLLVKSVINRCFRCWITNPRALEQLMGDIPTDRLQPCRPFLITGVDYIGPLKIHHKLRGKRPSKAYVSVFVCFVTKAIHVEVVSDLTTEAFIAAFKRFCGRRGSPSKIYSDNATNFQGAQRELKAAIESPDFQKEIKLRQIDWENIEPPRNLEIVWKNIPARSPHMGGLWEAAVKSIKTHYERVLVECSLTFEQLQTIMIEIEAMLNSRPLTPLSEDPNDFQVLTPSHFLIGEPMVLLPEKSTIQTTSIRNCWEIIKQSRLEFWKRWENEHVNELQKRHKWNSSFENIKPGTLVLLKDNKHTAPMNWKRARVIASIAGDDGRVRVVEVKTNTGITRRAVQMVCPLPSENVPVETSLNPTETESALMKSETPKQTKSKVHMQTSKFNKAPNLPQTSRVTRSQALKGYWEMHQGIHDAIDNLRSVCDDANQEFRKTTECKKVIQNLQTQIARKDSLHLFLFNMRHKRSLLGVVGTLAHDLFGVVDEPTAQKYEDQIQKHEKADQFLIGRLNEMAALHNSTVNIITENHDKILHGLRSLSEDMNSRNNMTHFDILVTRIIVTLDHFGALQSTIWDAVSHARKGVFNPSIIDPLQLSDALDDIRAQLPTSLTLPDNDIFEMLKLLQLRARATKEFVIFEISVPLAGSEVYNIFEAYSFPALHGKVMIEIKPQLRFILMNGVKDRYLTIPYEESNRCIKSKRKWLCFGANQVYLTNEYNNCEVRQLLGEAFGVLDECTIRITRPEPRFLQLATNEHWLFIAPFETNIETSCDNKLTVKQVIRGRGIISTDLGCMIRTPTSTLVTYESKNMSLTFTTPESNASYLLQIQNITKQLMTSNLSFVDFKWKGLPYAPPTSTSQGPTFEHHHLKMAYSSIILSIIVLLIVVINLMYKFRKTWFCCSKGDDIENPTKTIYTQEHERVQSTLQGRITERAPPSQPPIPSQRTSYPSRHTFENIIPNGNTELRYRDSI